MSYSVDIPRIGPEQFNDTSFSEGLTYWEQFGDCSIGDGYVIFGGDSAQLRQLQADIAKPIETNSSYTFVCDTSNAAGVIRFQVGSRLGTDYTSYTTYPEGNIEFEFETPDTITDGGLTIYVSSQSDYFEIHSESVKENIPAKMMVAPTGEYLWQVIS